MLVGAGEFDPAPTFDDGPVAARFALQRKTDTAVFTDVDDATTSMLGWPREEMVGRPSLAFVHDDDRAAAVESWVDMLASPGSTRRVRLRYTHANGSFVWLELTNHNRLDDAEFGCVVTECVDISDEMAAHEALRAREQLLRRIAETVPLGLLHVDRNGSVVYANERLHEILHSQADAGRSARQRRRRRPRGVRRRALRARRRRRGPRSAHGAPPRFAVWRNACARSACAR